MTSDEPDGERLVRVEVNVQHVAEALADMRSVLQTTSQDVTKIRQTVSNIENSASLNRVEVEGRFKQIDDWHRQHTKDHKDEMEKKEENETERRWLTATVIAGVLAASSVISIVISLMVH